MTSSPTSLESSAFEISLQVIFKMIRKTDEDIRGRAMSIRRPFGVRENRFRLLLAGMLVTLHLMGRVCCC